MLGRYSYSKAYVDSVRARVARQLKAFDKAKPPEPFAREAIENMVLALEAAFVHRLRKQEGKDGNALNEVRMLATALLETDGVFTRDSTVNWQAEKSVSGTRLGD